MRNVILIAMTYECAAGPVTNGTIFARIHINENIL